MARKLDYCRRHVDFDDFQPCFYEDNEWEEKSYITPTPSDDIWKKFELLPTPPRSPRRDEAETGVCQCQALFCSNATHKLSLVSGFMEYDDPISQTLFLPISDILIPSGNLKSNLIQDCMWSGLQGEEASKNITSVNKTSTLDDTVSSTRCVDPATVFPYPADTTTNRDHSYSASATSRIPVETPSDSEDEIDVVTVDKLQFPRKHHLNSATSVRASELREHLTVLARKRPADQVSMPTQIKKIRYNVQESDLKSVPLTKLSRSICSSRSSSQASSDSEECENGKRSQHNVLERKRRNDLKFSFLCLRDHVPELENQERAAKVVILRKASNYINSLNATHQKLVDELNAERERKERLVERLAELKSFEDPNFF